MRQFFLDTQQRLTDVCDQYEKSAPTVCDWADDLYARMNSEPDSVRQSELSLAWTLCDSDGWMQANYAANLVYKLQSRLGQSTVGHAGW